MDAPVKCTAVHCVRADRLYRPGEPLELSGADADALEAAGAVKRKRRSTNPPKGAGAEPLELSGADADALEAAGAVKRKRRSTNPPKGAGAAKTDARPVTLIKGIGPKTAEQFALFDVPVLTVMDLANISDENLPLAAVAIDVIGDELAAVTRWRAEARELLLQTGSADA